MDKPHTNKYWTTRIRPKAGWFDINLKEIWRYKDLIMLLVKRDFTLIYKQTILGPAWVVIQPLLTTLIFTVIFGNVAGLPTDGMPKFMFYMGGNIAWHYFADCLTTTSNTFITNRQLFGKVYFPRLTIPISNVLSSAIRFLIQMILVAGLLIFYYVTGTMTPHPIRLLLVPVILAWLGIMAMGCGIILSSLTVKYRDLSVLVGFGMSLWMYGTPVVYPLSTLSGTLRSIITLNPVTMPVELFRWAVLGTGSLSAVSAVCSLVFTATVFFAGVILFNRVERNFRDVV
jgi:lipopolysaccharide transport system permease protein